MKKLIIIFIALLCTIAINSCKDDETENNVTSNNYLITITELKSYTGKTIEQVDSIIKSKDFTFVASEIEGEESYYYYKSNDSLYLIAFSEYNEIVYESTAAFGNATDRGKGLSKFSYWSSDVEGFVNGLNYNYKNYYATIDSNEYSNRNDFLIAYNESKEGLFKCHEEWNLGNDNNNYSTYLCVSFRTSMSAPVYCITNNVAVITYIDNSFAPNKKNLKNLMGY